MGQYYVITNYTRKQVASVGKFYGEFEYYIKLFGWDVTDNISAHGDYGDVMHHNPQAPKEVSALDEEGVWSMCVFAAKKLGMDPADFYAEYLHEDAVDEDDFTSIDYYQMCKDANVKAIEALQEHSKEILQ